MTKLCSACKQDSPKESYSKKQCQLKQHQRRCKDCIADNIKSQPEEPKPERRPSNDNIKSIEPNVGIGGVTCWICLEEGPDENGQPLRRDCSCRGDSGYMHVSCVVRYAEQKSRGAYLPPNAISITPGDMELFCNPWRSCSNCHQEYQNELALEMANKLVEYVDTIQPQNDVLQIQALGMKCLAAQRMASDAKAMKIAKEVMSAIEVKKKYHDNAEDIPQPFITAEAGVNHNSRDIHPLFFVYEALANQCVGRCLIEMKTKNSAKQAVPYYERAKYMYESLGNVEIAADMDGQIKQAKSICGESVGGGDKNIQSELKATRNKYDTYVRKLGEHSPHATEAGFDLAIELYDAHHGIEAQRLITTKHSYCHRVHGPDHALTKKAESIMQRIKSRGVCVMVRHKLTVFNALKYTDDGTKCMIQGPVTNPRNVKKEKKYKVKSNDVYTDYGTPVLYHGMKNESLNGKIGDLRRKDAATAYIHFEDESLGSVFLGVKELSNNVRIVFDLPDPPKEDTNASK